MRFLFKGKAKTAKDPICGMDVDVGKPAGGTAEYEGKTYYFCSPGCRTAFMKDPAGTLKGGPKAMGSH